MAIVHDYPLTGVGLSMFRDGRVRAQYPASGFEGRILPHAHDEFLQVATDMGLPGLIVFGAIYGVAGWMVLRIWRRGDAAARILALALGAALLAHAVYGLTDAITLWDRFAFVFWLMLGLLAAQYALVMQTPPEQTD